MSTDHGSEYEERLRREIEHYTRVYEDDVSRQHLTQNVPASWNYIEGRAWSRIRDANEGRSSVDEVLHHLRRRGGGRILSIGSGPGGQELSMARSLRDSGTSYEFLCLDVNPQLVALGQERASAEGLNLSFGLQDINKVSLPEKAFDVVMCFSSLHHLLELEHVFSEISKSLHPDGELIVVDIVTRNGYLMWDETLKVVQTLWQVLPEPYKFNHTSYELPRIDREYRNLDYGADDMECVRSQDILPLLDHYFQCTTYVPYFSICRRFFDSKYGPCYDLTRPLDKAIVDFIWNLDVNYIEQHTLKPETFFGVYVRRANLPAQPPKLQEHGMHLPSGAPENPGAGGHGARTASAHAREGLLSKLKRRLGALLASSARRKQP